MKKSNSKLTENTNFFEVINTEEKAYWLGYILTNRCIVDNLTYRINISSTDKEHLLKIANIFNRKIYTHTSTTNIGNHETIYKLNINNHQLWQNLLDLDIYHGKSNPFETKVLNHIPENLTCDFIRGIFDGNGLIVEDNRKGYEQQCKFSIIGQYKILEQIQNILVTKLNIRQNIINKKLQEEVYQLQYGGKNQIKKIYKYLYKYASVYLERKREKFHRLLNTQWEKTNISYHRLDNLMQELCQKINKNYENIYSIPRGGCFPGIHLSHFLDIPMISNKKDKNITPEKTLIIDDILDSGITLKSYAEKGYDTAVLFYKPRAIIKPTYFTYLCPNYIWIVFPWEKYEELPNRKI